MTLAENGNNLTSRTGEQEHQNFICLGIVVNNQGEVLMIRRLKEETGSKGDKLTWAFPGGKLIGNESKENCVAREVLAETGYQVVPQKKIDFRYHPSFPVIIFYYRCSLVEEHPITQTNEPWEVQEIRWVKPEEIKNLITSPLNPEVAQELKIA